MRPTATVGIAMGALITVEAPNITKPLLDVCQE